MKKVQSIFRWRQDKMVKLRPVSQPLSSIPSERVKDIVWSLRPITSCLQLFTLDFDITNERQVFHQTALLCCKVWLSVYIIIASVMTSSWEEIMVNPKTIFVWCIIIRNIGQVATSILFQLTFLYMRFFKWKQFWMRVEKLEAIMRCDNVIERLRRLSIVLIVILIILVGLYIRLCVYITVQILKFPFSGISWNPSNHIFISSVARIFQVCLWFRMVYWRAPGKTS